MTRNQAKNLVRFAVREKQELTPENEYEWELLREYLLNTAEYMTHKTTLEKEEDLQVFSFIYQEVNRLDKHFYKDSWRPPESDKNARNSDIQIDL